MYAKMLSVLFIIILILIIVFYNQYSKNQEGYTNLESAMGNVTSEIDALVQNTYPITGRNGISNNGSADIWWHYPIFKLGSYAQITNNLKYPNNPDEGTCMPASMCGDLYHEKHIKNNYIKPLSSINPNCSTRIGYFLTDNNMLPFRTNIPNILY